MRYSFLFGGGGVVRAQGSIHGKVTDTENNPVEGVAVVLQTVDSVYIDAVLTDSMGVFLFENPVNQTNRLLFQHLLYIPCQKEITISDAGIIRMEAKSYELEGVTVKAERPKVKVENGALKYDVPPLIRDKAVSNAFEVIKQIPGIMGTDDVIQLIGAGSPAIILNSQLTTLSADQLTNLLKTILASRVKNVEVMYNAPARYNIQGAMINVVLDMDTSEGNAWQGEVGIDYEQRHYAGGNAHANLLYSTPRLHLDFWMDGAKGRNFMEEDIGARHTRENEVTEVLPLFNIFGR